MPFLLGHPPIPLLGLVDGPVPGPLPLKILARGLDVGLDELVRGDVALPVQGREHLVVRGQSLGLGGRVLEVLLAGLGLSSLEGFEAFLSLASLLGGCCAFVGGGGFRW